MSDQDMLILKNRVHSLEMDNARHLEKQKTYDRKLNKEFAEITGRVGSNDRMTREKYAEINALLDGFRDEIRVLTGRVETLEFLIDRDGAGDTAAASKELKRLDGAISRNYQRLMALEAHLGLEPTDTPSDTLPSDKPDGSESGMYTAAKTLLDNGDNKGARKNFETFIKTFPDSTNADNAQFWIADSYYRENWYEKAILEYQKVIEKYASGNKVPAALLKQGYAFANLGEKGNARLILKELIRKYPGTSEAKIAREKLETLD
ncbi:tol-pal system protein YbgF [Desulfocicer vacuolatum]|uniref:tol-pal system protein YbgF n=1 Tax=Desulfocicer vacuolatum TaxID=2298 RepID=UPI001BAE6656|nr:tol-pal system protein YbgF [Desulfocicer vacuolatum]